MSQRLLDELREDHASLRTMTRGFAALVDMVAAEDEPDYEFMAELLSCLLHFPEHCHFPLKRSLVANLRARRGDMEEFEQWWRREHRRVARIGRRLQRQFEHIAVEVPVPRRSFVRLAQRYLDRHEALLAVEEHELFPLLDSSLEPVDWLEATTRLYWYLDRLDAARASTAQHDLRYRLALTMGNQPPSTEAGLCHLLAAEE